MPSVSTFALIFKRNGLVVPRRRRRRTTPPAAAPRGGVTAPNQLWCIDFKGDFATGKSHCYPLTITDAHSRYLIACIALQNTRTATVRQAMRHVFEEFGLPVAIRTDNGPPFASPAPLGLSELSIWWMHFGIRHERIEPGKPYQNGQHERMHLTMKQDVCSPPQTSRRRQQRAFDLFRREYNDVRPHEALGNRVPANFYQPSPRLYRDVDERRDFTYEPYVFETARVSKDGSIYDFDGRTVFISAALRHQLLGLLWDAPHWDVYFGERRLGRLVRRRGKTVFVREEDVKRKKREEVSPMSLDSVSPMSSD